MSASRDTFVLLPGFLCDPRLWADFIKLISGMGHIIALDFKDCKDLAQMLEKIEDVPAKRFHLVGFSMGGYIAEQFTIQNSSRILSLSLFAVNVGALSERERSARLKMEDTLSRFHYRGMTTREVERYVHPSAMANSHIVDIIIAMSASYSSEMYINQMKATLDRVDVTASLAKFDFPILMVGGQDDRVVSVASLQTMKQHIPSARLELIPDCGHYIPLEKPQALAEVFKSFISLQV